MMDLATTAARSLARARKRYAQTTSLMLEADTPKAQKRLARRSKAARREIVSAHRLADALADY